MKQGLLITALTLLPLGAHAVDSCKSIVVYQEPLRCEDNPVVKKWSDAVPGGSDQAEVGEKTVAKFNRENKAKGISGRLLSGKPVDEKSDKDVIGHVTYRYQYKIMKLTCGFEDRMQYVDGSRAQQAPEGAKCLSCDEFEQSAPEKMSECLLGSIENVIDAGAVDLRPSDLRAVVEQIQSLLRVDEVEPFLKRDERRALRGFARENGAI